MRGPPAGDEARRHLSSSWEGCRWPPHRGSSRTGCGSWSSRSCQGGSAVIAIRAAALARPAGIAGDSVRAAYRVRLAASAARAGFGSGITCWRRLDERQRAGVWERLHQLLLTRLRAAGEIEWSRAIIDSSQVQAKKGAARRARARSTEAVPAPSTTSSSTRRDPARFRSHRLEPQRRHAADPPGRRAARGAGPGRPPASAAQCVIADRGYDHDRYRRLLRKRGIKPVIARRQTEHGSGLGRYRWVVERTFAWLAQLQAPTRPL